MIDILFRDQDLLILNKPANYLCVPGLSTPANLFDLAKQDYPNLRVVHRLDMATSGIVVFALNHQAQKTLGQQFERRQIKKRYCAIVDGTPAASQGDIVQPLICDWPNRPKQKIDYKLGKYAHTFFSVRWATHNQCELALHPITGRSHQLRVHCQSIGHPIVGDQLYNAQATDSRMMLHAEYISFTHPSTLKPITIHSVAPFSLSSQRDAPENH